MSIESVQLECFVQLAIIVIYTRDNGSFFDSNAVKITRYLCTTTMLNNVIRLLPAKCKWGMRFPSPVLFAPVMYRVTNIGAEEKGKWETRLLVIANASNYFS